MMFVYGPEKFTSMVDPIRFEIIIEESEIIPTKKARISRFLNPFLRKDDLVYSRVWGGDEKEEDE